MKLQATTQNNVSSQHIVQSGTISEAKPQTRAQSLEAPQAVSQVSSRKVEPSAAAIVRWNGIARDLVSKAKTAPPLASRLYTMLSVAQQRALEIASTNGRVSGPAAIEAASTALLRAMFPDDGEAISAKASETAQSRRTMPGQGSRSEARKIGERVAQSVIDERKNDGHDAQWKGTVPSPEPGVWRSTSEPPKPPALPMWGDVKPWFMPEKGAANRPAPPAPPSIDSKAYKDALAEVRRISDTRTPEQLEIAMFWADNAGTATPPGHWNQIACDYLLREGASGEQVAKTLAAMNAAMCDAGIACWQAKYDHWLIRPSQADTKIVVPEKLGLPNFPAYVSGHASFSGAAAEVLGHVMPEHKETFEKMADEAALSRVYGGIHFMFDGTEGVKLGKKAAEFAIQAMR
jgi:hypothetical protein